MAASAEEIESNVDALFSCENSADDIEIYLSAGQMVHSVAFSMVLHTAIELGLFDIMARAGLGSQLSAADVAVHLPTENPDAPAMLDRMLRLLSAFSVLKCSVVTGGDGGAQRLYSLAPVAKYFVPNEDGVSLGPAMSMLHDKVFLGSWGKLKEAILEGGTPFNKAHGSHAFEYFGMDPRFNKVFNAAMYNVSTIYMNKIILSYGCGFENIRQLVDVGGGVGDALKTIVSKYPHIKGINYDLPHVIQHAIPCSGVEHIGGDMFESVPSGDAIWMKLILHDWSDDLCVKLLKNCYKSLPDNGKLIVVDTIVPEGPDTSDLAKLITLSDVTMMTQHLGGKERTHKEFLALAKASAFSGIKLICRVYNQCIMEFYK